MFAHRGASKRAKDNTIEAFEIARDVGADGIEFDVRLTFDNVMVIHHDASARGVGVLRRKRFDAIRAARPDIPTLDEVLAVAGSMQLNAELKNDPKDPDHDPKHRVARLLADWIDRNEVQQRMLVTSFNEATIDAMRFAGRRVATGTLFDRRAKFDGEWKRLAERGHQWILPYHRTLRKDCERFMAAAHHNGMRVGTWTVDGQRAIAKLAECGVHAVITNDPEKALSALA